GADDRIVAADRQQVAMQGVHLTVAITLGQIELAARERRVIARWREMILDVPIRGTRELLEELAASGRDGLGQLRRVIGEEQERGRSRELLPLKEHRGSGAEQRQRGQRPQLSRRRQLVDALAVGAVRNLIV